ncbi:MAG TPA: hypothetical protein VGW34_14385 [Allosphingosinicella sp.]|nr:hypothetical protein [Allosphingosinicella sp.]
MSKPSRIRSAAIRLLTLVGTSCGPAASDKVLTVEEVVPRIDELDGQTVSVAGYLSECEGYDCILYRNKEDADERERFLVAIRVNKRAPVPDRPMLGIGTGTKLEFDAKAAPFRNSYVVITGTITNKCRYQGKSACTDRTTDLEPTEIREIRDSIHFPDRE